MQIFLLILFGFLAGIIGGMGMGGGTLLVPLLSFLDIPQKTVQAINLISFLPMCVVALGLHVKNKLVKTQHVLWIIIPALAFAVVGALVADGTDNKILRWCFAVFLIAVGVWQLVVGIKFALNGKKQSATPNKRIYKCKTTTVLRLVNHPVKLLKGQILLVDKRRHSACKSKLRCQKHCFCKCQNCKSAPIE